MSKQHDISTFDGYFCLQCNKSCGTIRLFFSHIKNVHKMSLCDYVLHSYYAGIIPKCKCGCGNSVLWNNFARNFNTFIKGHNESGFCISTQKTNVLCSCCGKEFFTTAGKIKHAKQFYCSNDCYRKKCELTHITKICENCHKEFVRPKSIKQTRFCSWKCYREFGGPQRTTKHNQIGPRKGTKGKYIDGYDKITYFDSRLELRRMKELSEDVTVKAWCRSKHRIPWIDNSGVERIYYPDFDVEYVNGISCIEEIKGVFDENSKMKILAGEQYAKTHGLMFRVLNQYDMQHFVPAFEIYENEYGLWKRPTFESTFMNMAHSFAQRSTCLRLKVGAVFTDQKYTRVLCVGYNGGLSGDKNQCESLQPGNCGCIHAEVNAIMHAQESLAGSHLFVTTAPCNACAKLIAMRGITKIFYDKSYRDKSGLYLLKSQKIDLIRWCDYVYKCDNNIISRFC